VEHKNLAAWSMDWAWGLPLIVMSAVFHAYCLGLINEDISSRLGGMRRSWHLSFRSIFVIGGTVLSATALHAIEAFSWAAAYLLLVACFDYRSAVLYSMNAMTSYGHASLFLEPHWQMMGALEALKGRILFGLTTAFLFAVVQKAWSNADP
jgi:hypothetical protein